MSDTREKLEAIGLTQKLKEAKEEIARLRVLVAAATVEAAVQAAFMEPDGPALFMAPVLRERTRAVIDEKGARAHVVDDKGRERIAVSTSGKTSPMQPRELLEELRKEPTYAPIFAEAKKGGGPEGDGGPAPATNLTELSRQVRRGGQALDPALREQVIASNPFAPATHNLTLQSAVIRRDPQLAARLRREAEVAA